jgi:alanyl-tRNA synthetase
MTGSDIRALFLRFFEERGHKIVPSSSLVPANDPTLLFTNAGMNQFKDVFLGIEKRDYSRATTAQKCVRAGGKHNDLDNVGFTNRHHTFFEMLGNFSFGDYFKADAVSYAWELVTGNSGYGIERDRLYATVFEDDDQAYELWTKTIGLTADRVFRLGEKDNFWAMGDTGPCGPCSELHVDLGPAASESGHVDCRFPCDCGRYVEIWNLVFMQFERDASGKMTPLPRPSIDTGAGLERLTAVLQGKLSNYDTDLFQPLIARAGELAGVRYGQSDRTDVSLRIIADHSRATAFLVADGVLPSNEGRGYVLRKIMRRAIRHGRTLGIADPFLHTMAALVAGEMRGAYPELLEAQERVGRIILGEEERFSHTMALALKEFEKVQVRYPGGLTASIGDVTRALRTLSDAPGDRAIRDAAAQGRGVVNGREIFRLYDTFGLALDVLHELGNDLLLELDLPTFHAEMEAQRQRARASWKGGDKASAAGVYRELASRGRTVFEGYEKTFTHDATIVALIRDGQQVDSAQPGEQIEAVLDRTPFYAASGGQIGDVGTWITGEGVAADVLDTYAPVAGLSVHRIRTRQALRRGEKIEAAVDAARRDSTRRNHTATHLLHAALRRVLGSHVKQAGSVVEPGRLRFDFTHYTAVTPDEIEQIERLVNHEILHNDEVRTDIMPLEQAVQTGAMALFGEKYQDVVRVVSVPDFSRELCGGTHCRRTGDIGLFKIVYEGSVASGVRRIEALTGEAAWEQYREAAERLHRLSEMMRTNEPELVQAVERMIELQRQMQRELERAKLKSAQSQAGSQLEDRRRTIKGVQVVSTRVDRLERSQLRNLVDELRGKLGSGIVVLGSADDGKTAVIVGVTPDLTGRVQAGRIIKALPGISGGGRPDMAEAGGKDPEGLNAALDKVYEIVEQML